MCRNLLKVTQMMDITWLRKGWCCCCCVCVDWRSDVNVVVRVCVGGGVILLLLLCVVGGRG